MSWTEHHSVTLFESRTTIESGTTGLRTWRASFVLAQFLIQNPCMACVTKLFAIFMPHHPAVLVNKPALELGSGTGFLGLIVADIQISHGGVSECPFLYLTDVNDDVLRQCSENTQLPCSRRSACVVDLQLSYFPDASHRYGNLSVKSLDWFDAMVQARVPDVQASLNSIKPDLVLGADIVSNSLLVKCGAHDQMIPCAAVSP